MVSVQWCRVERNVLFVGMRSDCDAGIGNAVEVKHFINIMMLLLVWVIDLPLCAEIVCLR